MYHSLVDKGASFNTIFCLTKLGSESRFNRRPAHRASYLGSMILAVVYDVSGVIFKHLSTRKPTTCIAPSKNCGGTIPPANIPSAIFGFCLFELFILIITDSFDLAQCRKPFKEAAMFKFLSQLS